MRVLAISHFARLRIGVHLDYSIIHESESTFQGKAHYMSFGCSKACPRYHATKNRRASLRLIERVTLQFLSVT
jgi:hypothetical protein